MRVLGASPVRRLETGISIGRFEGGPFPIFPYPIGGFPAGVFQSHMNPTQKVAATLLFGSILQGAALGQSLVYDNTTTLRTNVIYRFSKEYGDEVALAPGYRTISQFAFQYFGDFNPTNRLDATAKVRFYANDGPDADPGPKVIPMPGASPLWESDSFPLLTGYNIVSLDVPWVEVPNVLIWTVQFSGVTGANKDAAGLALADPPTVGGVLADGKVGSFWDAWIRNDPNRVDSWSLINFGFRENDPKANFYARIHAVPEPSTWALMVSGGVLLALAVRRRS